MEELNLHILNQRLVDQKRLNSCSVDVIKIFFCSVH